MATLFPGYFAMVMATGIVAVAASQQDIDWLAQVLYVIAAVAYVVLAVLLILRVVLYSRLFTADLTNHAKGFAFLTTVAGTNVLGAASVVIHGWYDLAWVLWWLSVVLWAGFLYATLIAVVIRSGKPGLQAGHQRHLVPAHGVHRVHRCPRCPPAGARRRRGARLRGVGLLHAGRRAVPDRDDDGVPALDVPRARPHGSRPAGLDRGRRRRHHRAGGLQPAARRADAPRGSSARHRSSRGSSCWPGRRRRSGSR